MSTSREESAEGRSTGRLGLDQAYFRLAQNLVRDYWEKESEIPEDRRPLAQIAYAAASIALVCAAVEAQANYLLVQSAKGELPNMIGLSVGGCDALINSLTNLRAKWLFTCVAVTGRQLLDPGSPPFQALCEAIDTRNNYIAHAKFKEQPSPSNPTQWEEATKLNIAKAEAAIDAGQKTVCAIYAEMGKTPPVWATSEGGESFPSQSVTIYGPTLRLSLTPGAMGVEAAQDAAPVAGAEENVDS
jgi:hypothetical protein